MSCLSAAQKAELQAQIDEIDAELVAIRAAYLAALGNSEYKETDFRSAEGRQRVERRAPRELREEKRQLQATRKNLQSRLDGTGIVSMPMRRGGFGRRHYG